MAKRRTRSAGPVRILAVALVALLLWGANALLKDRNRDAVAPSSSPLAGETLTLQVLDVGQGSAALLTLPGGKRMLVDAGSKNTGAPEALAELGVQRLDLVVATHPHEDHIGSLAEVIGQCDVGAVYMPRLPKDLTPTTATYRNLLTAIKEKGLRVHAPAQGEVLYDENGVVIRSLYDPAGDYDNVNDCSLILMVQYGEISLLLPGDSGPEPQQAAMAAYDVSADAYLVAHHGSADYAEGWIEAIAPAQALISCGEDNSYGHPSARVLEDLERAQARVWRTDRNGAITLVTDGEQLTVTAER